MLTFSLIIALILDRTFEDLQDYRSFQWLGNYYRWLVENWKIDQFGFWAASGFTLLSILLLVGLLNGLFHTAVFGLFELAFYVVIGILCIGPRSLDRDIDVYIDGLEAENPQQLSSATASFAGNAENSESTEALAQVAGNIFVMANRSLYSVIFWLVLVGPVAAVGYRLIERMAMQIQFSDKLDWQSRAVQIMAWMEWIPALLSSYAFMICGSFDAGLSRSQKLPMFAQELDRLNCQRLHQVGLACSGIDTDSEQLDPVDKIKKVRGLVLRSLVVWIAFAGLFQFLT